MIVEQPESPSYGGPVRLPPVDLEIDAIDRCLRALLPLAADARSRVLDYLDARLKPDEGA